MTAPDNPNNDAPADAGNGATPDARSGDRIAKLLARAGIASRREVERMIAEGRVKLGDEVITTANTVLTSLKGVSVDGKFVKAPDAARMFLFHKPAGLITAERDPGGRPTIYTALRNALPANAGRVMPIGRLDFNTEGLLLLTNDGGLKRTMELPSTGLPRTYRARTFGEITQEQLEELSEGIEVEGVRYGPINANMERSTGRNQWIEVTITEGKNREVRRVLEHLGLEVSRLIRTAYGPYQLLDLPRGLAVEVKQADLERFMKTLKVPGAPTEARPAHEQARLRIRRDGPRAGTGGKPAGRKPSPTKPPEPRNPAPRRPGGGPAPRGSGPRSSGPRSSGPRNSGPGRK